MSGACMRGMHMHALMHDYVLGREAHVCYFAKKCIYRVFVAHLDGQTL